MPFKARRPAGGFRVMYEYANRLADLGYTVHITYPLKTKHMKYRWSYPIRWILSQIEGFKTNEWFCFRENITRGYCKSVSDKYISDSDIVIATWWSTAFDMGKLSISKGKKINLIQGYENWEGHSELLHSSYNMDATTNVVVASYLKEIVTQYTNNPTVLIPNAIDNKVFRITETIENRNNNTICMMYSVQEIKGSEYGIKALEIVQKQYPDLKVELFGICPEPENLPDWIKFHRDPKDLHNLYNRNAIFISNSFTEGMALTPMEAMASGCAAILTDIQGHSDYAKDNETALLYEVKNVDQLADKVIELLENKDKRVLIAKTGNSFIQQFSWDNAVKKMDSLIKELIKD